MEVRSLVQRGEFEWEIPCRGQMKVPGLIFASRRLLEEMDEKVREQVTNVACLPGIVGASMAMPDAHWGYGFPIGGVAAFDPEAGGIISVGGVGYDISCGVRCLRTGLKREEVAPRLEELVDALFARVPAGVGSEGRIRLSLSQLDEVLVEGAQWAVSRGYGLPEDLEFTEERGRLAGADPACVSPEAKKRQHRQVGTLGSGNHYLEVQVVEEVYHAEAARAFGLEPGDVVISIHCGSRALGHQIATDYLKVLARAAEKYGLPIREKELVCAPILSPEGERYWKAMVCGVNCALANRQVITHLVREVFADLFPRATVSVLYDVSHNTCKVEEHLVEGRRRRLYVHRKGATRAWGPGRPELPAPYRDVGQPVLIGGSMGTASYILVGTREGEEKAFASACHGAGRTMSRHQALKRWRGEKVMQDLRRRGILVRARSKRGAAEEAPGAYKNVDEVVEVAHRTGLARKVARLLPLGCIKG